MIDELMGAYGSRLLIAVAGVGVALILLIVILWLVRRRGGPSPFIRGGKNRAPRLQVLDAAAVDTRRRIVLIRRDDVEHLVMIGGPTDIVIESGIQPEGTSAPSKPVSYERAPPEAIASPQPAEQPRVPERSRPAAIAAQPQPAPVAIVRPEPAALKVDVRPVTEQAPAAPIAKSIPAEPTSLPNVAAAVAPTSDPVALQKREPVGIRPAPQAAAAAEVSTPPRIAEPQPTPKPVEGNLGAATDALDEARRRVFQTAAAAAAQPKPAIASPLQPQPAQVRPQRVEPEVSIAPPAPQTAPTKTLGTDFERILEEEMANNLAANRSPSEPVSASTLPNRDPSQPRVTGASPEPSLQNEVARIFGEMSVTRDDRA
ncbi:flagellar biosynthetic protein FliO [Rhizobium oryzicola]|uniref:Flagellar biosynthetic protein FliO n=1 Tax=Rhizobium oryzicola TaxID=1232668 RepID=A0ABT8T2Y9_9HYPH|nr:flagellar biosynthetic protein FliO [Rhizobium oryzicola]MDO1584541.1 flagellar biosynthetic protein FliO [Rhizobium oryzicola]